MSDERRLSAIMFTDLVGYTAVMGRNSGEARALVERSRKQIRRQVDNFNGQWLEETGEVTMSAFSSATDAADCALTIQTELRGDPELKLRIGLHLGDVVFSNGHINGDGVNVAARIERFAEPGGIAITESMRIALRGHAHAITHLGRKHLKNVDEPVNVYALEEPADGGTHSSGGKEVSRFSKHYWKWIGAGAAACLVAALAWVGLSPMPDDGAPTPREPPTLAVLPFANVSDNPHDEYFSDGFTEEMINRLASIEGLRVSGRTASFAFKNSEATLDEINELLDVETVLEGSVRKVGNAVRITAHLVDTESGYQLWQDTYERQIDDIFTVQAEIATAVAEQLDIILTDATDAALHGRPTHSIPAYNLYLQGLAYLHRPLNETNLGFANELFSGALVEDTGYARAYAGLCRVALARYELTNSPDYLDVAEEKCLRALELDRSLDSVRTALAQVYAKTGRADQAVELYRRVLQSSPGNAEALVGLGATLAAQGAADEAEVALRKAVVIQPGNWKAQMALGEYYYWDGRFEDAEERFTQVTALTPDNVEALSYLGSAYLVTGRFEQAKEVFLRAIALDPSRSVYRNLGLLFSYQEQYEAAVTYLRHAVSLSPEDHWSWGVLAKALKNSEDLDSANAAYAKAIALARAVLKRNPEDWTTMGALALYLADVGKVEEATGLIEAALSGDSDNAELWGFAAEIALRQGKSVEAIERLEKAVGLGFPLHFIRRYPGWDTLRANARFMKIIASHKDISP